MALYIDFDDLTPEATKRLLKEAVCGEMVRQLPMSKRAAARARMHEQAEGEDEEYERDREQLADLKEEAIGSNSVAVSGRDFGPQVVRNPIPDLPGPVAKGNLPKVSKSAKAKRK